MRPLSTKPYSENSRFHNDNLPPLTRAFPIVGFKGPMLAPTEGTPDEFIEQGKVKWPKSISPKLDGIRATYHVGGLLSRSLKPIPNRFVNYTVNEMAKKLGKEFEGLDGELIVGSPTAPDVYNVSQSGIMAKDGEPDFSWHVFDRYHQFNAARGEKHEIYLERLARANRIVESLNDPRLKIVPHMMCTSKEYLYEFEDWAATVGYEGVMLNDPYAMYQCKRGSLVSQFLLKRKPFVDFEAEILSTYEQLENTNEAVTNELGRSKRSSHQDGKVPKGTLGGFTVRSLTDGVVFNVGSGVGLTQVLRQSLWDTRHTLPGKLVKVRKQKVGEKDKPRQPKFMGFRTLDDMSSFQGNNPQVAVLDEASGLFD